MAFDSEEGVPGLFDYKCMACSKSDFEVLGADLERLCGFTRQQIKNLTARGSLPVWCMDGRLLQSTQRSMKVSRASVPE
jgi:hypothetical protein